MKINNLSKLNTPHQGIPIGVVTNSHGEEKEMEMEIFEFPEVNILKRELMLQLFCLIY